MKCGIEMKKRASFEACPFLSRQLQDAIAATASYSFGLGIDTTFTAMVWTE